MTAAIILAAGASTRLGEPKQLATLAGETLLARAVRTAREAGCEPIVVLGCGADLLRADLSADVETVVAEDWREGMGASLRAGVRALPSAAQGAIVMTCDQPAVTAVHLRALMEAGADACAASSYAGRRGVPAYFSRAQMEPLKHAAGDAGARGLLRSAASVALPGGELDIDTPEDLARARTLAQANPHG